MKMKKILAMLLAMAMAMALAACGGKNASAPSGGNNAGQSEKLLEACRQTLGEEPALSYRIGGVIAINAGPNLIGVIYRV